jgi:hypothetical protein
MNNRNNLGRTEAARRALALLFAAAFGVACFGAAAHTQAAAASVKAPGQSGHVPQPRQTPPQTKRAADDEDDDKDEGEDEDGGGATAAAARPQAADPGTILRRARAVYVRSDSAFVSGREVEASLLKRKEFKAWGMVVTRDASEADLVIEITRRPLTRRFTFSVIDTRTLEVVASGKTRSVLFGKKIPNKIAEKFANRVKVYRPYP